MRPIVKVKTGCLEGALAEGVELERELKQELRFEPRGHFDLEFPGKFGAVGFSYNLGILNLWLMSLCIICSKPRVRCREVGAFSSPRPDRFGLQTRRR